METVNPGNRNNSTNHVFWIQCLTQWVLLPRGCCLDSKRETRNQTGRQTCIKEGYSRRPKMKKKVFPTASMKFHSLALCLLLLQAAASAGKAGKA